MTAKHLDSRVRISLYIGVAAVGAILAAWGVITQELVDAILPVVGGVLTVGGGVTAVRNITPTDRGHGPEVLEWAAIGRENIPVILDELRRLRETVEGQAVEATGHTPAGAIEYVPEQAPWLPEAYVGEHRLVE